jgi:2-methylcitrate dehydratase PrpD
MRLSPTADLSEFIKSLSYFSTPPAVIKHAKLCILDTIGCGLFGSTLPWTKILIDELNELDSNRQAPIWGTGHMYSMTNAALVNGTMVHGFELDDLHSRGIIHPGSVTVPPTMALAINRGKISGKKFIEAIVAGYEVGVRVGMLVGTSHLLRGFHPTGTCGTFASAAATGKLLDLSNDELMNALGIAGAQSAGLMAAQYSSMVKRMHAGKAAQSGLFATLLAKKGFTGAKDILEAEYGGFGTSMSDRMDLDSSLEGLGYSYELINVGFKPHACCGSNHTTIDALRDINQEEKIEPDMVENIEIRTTRATKLHVGWPYSPDSVTSAQMNLYYCAAIYVLDGEAFIDQFTDDKISDPRVLNFLPKITIKEDPNLNAGGSEKRHSVLVRVLLNDGRKFERKIDYPLGSPNNPMALGDLVGKFRKLARKVLQDPKTDRLIEKILNLDEAEDVNELNELLI